MALRDAWGGDAVEEALEERRRRGEGLPPSRGLQRSHAQAHAVLYAKGAVILYDFAQKVGEAVFSTILRRQVSEKVVSTQELLNLVADEAGEARAEELSRALET